MKLSIIVLALGTFVPSHGFIQPSSFGTRVRHSRTSNTITCMSSTEVTPESETLQSEFPPILMELRDVAMKLHTKEQAPREGQAAASEKPKEPFVPTQADYLKFLVDSCQAYKTLEEVVDRDELTEELGRFRNTGLERTNALEQDIQWMCDKFSLERPPVGRPGQSYSDELRNMITVKEDGTKEGIPEFVCHYYNFVFAHLAGGRMIGKQMSKMLLDGETLDFYKWGDDVNDLKAKVKDEIEVLAQGWTRKERDECVGATAEAFKGGGAINGYLYGGSPH